MSSHLVSQVFVMNLIILLVILSPFFPSYHKSSTVLGMSIDSTKINKSFVQTQTNESQELIVQEAQELKEKIIGKQDPKQNQNQVECVCEGDGACERLGAGEDECRWGVTLDFCGCCLICSRGPGEPCGGAVGNCAQGFYCQNDNYSSNEENNQNEGQISSTEGICSSSGDSRLCESTVNLYGCMFYDGECVCEQHSVCPQMEIFLFPSQQACLSRIELLTKIQ